MKKIDMNRGMQKLVESYQPRISKTCVLDFLKDKGFDISAKETQNYAEAVSEYLDYSPEDYSLEDWFKDTEMNYPEDFRLLPKINESIEESLSDDDAIDFVHDLSEYVKQCARKWKRRGISVADVVRALDELSVKYEDLTDEDF